MNYKGLFFSICFLWAGLITTVCAQTKPDPRRGLENLVRKEGEIYVAVERYEPEKQKKCRIEDVFTNSVLVSHDSLTVPYANHTESFCEAFVLHSQLVYQIHLRDVDPAKLILAQRKYDYGTAKLLEGQPVWYEVHLTALNGKSLVHRRDVINKESDHIPTLRMLFQTKEGATKGLALLRQLVTGAAQK